MASSDRQRLISDHASAVSEAADAAEAVLACFEIERPDDDRPRKAIAAARAWLRGEIKVGEARKAAFAAHAAARDSEGAAACAAARAAGHAAATVHVVTHALHAVAYARKAASLPGECGEG